MSQLAASPIKTAPYACAAFVPEIKGRPAQVKLFAFPPPPDGAADGQVSAKAFYRAQDCKLSWSPGGHGVLVQTHTDVDATGGSRDVRADASLTNRGDAAAVVRG